MARIAIMVGQDFEDSEFRVPYDRLTAAGHEVTVLGKQAGEKLSGEHGKQTTTVDAAAKDRSPEEFDALVIPGGYSPDKLRTDPDVVRFVRDFVDTGKLVAAVCHGPQLLIEADRADGRTMTSWPSVRKDLANAGAEVVDREVVHDGSLITSRKPDDLEAFSREILRSLPSAAE